MHPFRHFSKIVLALSAVAFLASCGNTVRGIGRDTANAVDATKQAGRDIADSF